ncbi:enoyl-CoA hydratase/isomerase family protein [Variovorax sp.]|jgi:enoyl-CoA hydratase/carnithine racemase|uniref:enoyl-CoA hydratase/isomerase family protein n=1 Tax=Variovorax sp. TaxID=1871043 RepID=UPI0037DA3284
MRSADTPEGAAPLERTLRESCLRVRDGIAELSHQRPAVRNVMSLELRADYIEVLELVERTPEVRVLILTGSGGSFCAGGDVKAMLSRASEPGVAAATRQRLLAVHRGWLDRLRSLDVPVIAAVDGAAYGAGLSLSLMADFVLASTRADFCCAFARIGAVPDFGAFYMLPRLLGLARAKELAMTARRFGAKEARTMGMVHAVHAPEDLLPAAHALAARLARGPREALGMIKSSLNRSFDVDYQTMGEIEAHQQAVALTTAFHAEAAARFANRQPPLYDWG